MATVDDYRRQGRAEAVVLIFIQLGRSIPALTVEDVAGMAGLPARELGAAVRRLRAGHVGGVLPRRVAAARAAISIGTCRCGASIFQPPGPGAPRKLCDDCAPYRKRGREEAS